MEKCGFQRIRDAKRQIPSSKLQAPNFKFQAPNSNTENPKSKSQLGHISLIPWWLIPDQPVFWTMNYEL